MVYRLWKEVVNQNVEKFCLWFVVICQQQTIIRNAFECFDSKS